ncbi:MAG: hypothetical protein ACFFDI_27650 [Promethearchaeota archaeon]
MPRLSERERNRIVTEISKYESLLETVRAKIYKAPHLEKFEELIEDCYVALKEERQLSKRFREITSHVSPEIASRRLAELRFQIKKLFDILYVALSNSFEIPRELYFLSDIFLKYHEVATDYIIFVSDEIAMFSFIDALESIGFREGYPEFWNRMRNKKFYFVQVVPEFKKEGASLDWPIILHEIAHLICYHMGTIQMYFPELPLRSALEIAQSYSPESQRIPRFLFILAQKKLYITEHLADLMVTRCFGALYGWRLLKGYVSLKDIFEPGRSHPSPEKRLQKIISEVKDELQMPDCAQFLSQELKSFTEKGIMHPENRVPEIDVDSVLSSVLDEVHNYSKYIITYEEVKKSIQSSNWYQILKQKKKTREKLGNNQFNEFLKQLQDELLQGIPIVVDPPTLYFLATLDFSNPGKLSKLDDSKAESIRELIADTIRLYAIKHRYATEVK